MVVGGIADMLGIFDFWQRRSSAPPGLSEPHSPVEGGGPSEAPSQAAEQAPGGDTIASDRESRTATESREPTRQAPEPDTSKVESLVNYRVIPSGSVPVMAIALDGASPDAELLEVALAQGISSAELRLVSGVFKPAFRERGFLHAVYEGDTSALAGNGALAGVDRFLIGRVERSCRETGQLDSDLVTCDVRLSFKVFDRHGAMANAGHVAVAGAGFSEDAARDRAVEMLVQQYGKRVISTE